MKSKRDTPKVMLSSEHLAGLKDAYDAGNEAALYEATVFLTNVGVGSMDAVGVPGWVWTGVQKVLSDRLLGRSPGKPSTRSPKTQYHSNKKHLIRYQRVRSAKDNGESWDSAYTIASDSLKGTWAQGSERTMKESYLKINRDMKNPDCKAFLYSFLPETDWLLRDS